MEKKSIDYGKLGQERIITVADLIKEIVRKFWLVIVLAIVFAGLLGGYKYVKDSKAVETEKIAENTSDVSSSNLSAEDQEAVQNVLLVQDNLLQQQEYADNSVLMQIDPLKEDIVILQYYFDTEQSVGSDVRYSLLNAYQNYVNEGNLAADLEEYGQQIEVQYLGELITCETNMNDSSNMVLIEGIGTSFTIKVIHEDQELCTSLAEDIKACIQQYQINLNNTMGRHELELVDESYSQVVDKDLWTYKFDRVNSITSMQEKIDALKENLSEDQLAVVEAYSSQAKDENIEAEDSSTNVSVSISKKYVLVGGAIGVVLACLFIIIAYIMRGTINKAEDLQYLYNLRILGEIGSGNNNIFLAIWNKVIGRKEKRLGLEEQAELLRTNLKLVCEKRQQQKILLCGNDEKGLHRVKKLLEGFCKQNVQLEYVADLLYTPASLSKLSGADSIIFVEQVHKSQYTDIVKKIEICSEQDIEILGVIVFNA